MKSNNSEFSIYCMLSIIYFTLINFLHTQYSYFKSSTYMQFLEYLTFIEKRCMLVIHHIIVGCVRFNNYFTFNRMIGNFQNRKIFDRIHSAVV